MRVVELHSQGGKENWWGWNEDVENDCGKNEKGHTKERVCERKDESDIGPE